MTFKSTIVDGEHFAIDTDIIAGWLYYDNYKPMNANKLRLVFGDGVGEDFFGSLAESIFENILKPLLK